MILDCEPWPARVVDGLKLFLAFEDNSEMSLLNVRPRSVLVPGHQSEHSLLLVPEHKYGHRAGHGH